MKDGVFHKDPQIGAGARPLQRCRPPEGDAPR